MTTLPTSIYDTVIDYDYIQTFYADPEKVNSAGGVEVTSIELFFKTKPDQNLNASGKASPGVAVRICEVRNDDPVLTRVLPGIAYTRFEDITAFSDASFGSIFSFNEPIFIETGKSYGVIVAFEDPGYELWENVAGDNLVGTSTPSPGSNLVKDGRLYRYTNAGQYRALNDRDLKFTIRINQYAATNTNISYINNDLEYFTVSSQSGVFLGGEYVWQQVANDSGTVAYSRGDTFIVSNTANFTTSSVVAGDKIVLWANTTYQQVVTVDEVTNATHLALTTQLSVSNAASDWMRPPVGIVHVTSLPERKLFLRDSNANSTLQFAANSNILTGEDSRATCLISSLDYLSADRIKVRADYRGSPVFLIDAWVTAANFNGISYGWDGTLRGEIPINALRMQNVKGYDGRILSRSEEVVTATLLEEDLQDDSTYRINRKSAVVNVDISSTVSNTNLFQAPTMPEQIGIYVSTNLIGNVYTTTDANGVTIDTEVAGPGTATARHITKKVTFANNKFAEDARAYVTAYRPAGTDVKVYARLHNSADPEAFDDKAWTPMVYKDSATRFSSTEDEGDFIEYEIGLPNYQESANVLPGVFTTQLSNNVLVAEGVTPTSYVAVNDVVKLYNPLIPQDYIIGVVEAANTTAIELGSEVANNNLVGNGFKVDRLKYYNAAFNNITTDNVVRYYSSSLVEYDTFDAMQFKIVLLADTTYVTPKVDSISVIGVSA